MAIAHAIDSWVAVLLLNDELTVLQMTSGVIYVLKMEKEEMHICKIITEFGIFWVVILKEEFKLKTWVLRELAGVIVRSIHTQQVSLYFWACVVLWATIKGVFGIDVETEKIEFNYMIQNLKQPLWPIKSNFGVSGWIYNDPKNQDDLTSIDWIAIWCNLYF